MEISFGKEVRFRKRKKSTIDEFVTTGEFIPVIRRNSMEVM